MTITKISSHIKNVCNKANRLLGFLRRNLDHCSYNLKETAYKHLILPCLGYCAPIWDPFHHNLIYQMEMVQHRAAHLVLNQPWTRGRHDSITEILHTFDWTTLETQRGSCCSLKFWITIFLFQIYTYQLESIINYQM